MPTVNNQGLDQQAANAFTILGNVVSFPFQTMGFIVDKVDQLLPDVVEKRHYKTDVPALIDVARRVFYAFYDYHTKILKNTKEWSNDVERCTEKFVRKILFPFSICRFGRAIQTTIAKDVLGNIAKAISWVVLQLFHLTPYFLMISSSTGISYILNIAIPLPFLAASAVTILSLQAYFIYSLVKEIELSNKILEEKLDQVTNFVGVAKQNIKVMKGIVNVNLQRLKNAGLRAWRWGVSHIPSRRSSQPTMRQDIR